MKEQLNATFSDPDQRVINYLKPEHLMAQAQQAQDAYNALPNTDPEGRIFSEYVDSIDDDPDAVNMQERYAKAAGTREDLRPAESPKGTGEAQQVHSTESASRSKKAKAPEENKPKKAPAASEKPVDKPAENETSSMTVGEEFAAIKKELQDLRVQLRSGMTPKEMQDLLDKAQREADKASAGISELNAKYGLTNEDRVAKKPVDPADRARALKDAENNEKIKGFQENLNKTRDDYTRLVAGRSRRVSSLFKREFSKKNVEAAKKAYEEARDLLGGVVAHLYVEAGASNEDLDAGAWAGAGQEKLALVRGLKEQKLLATGNYTRNEQTGAVERIERTGIKGLIDKASGKFYDFYARNSVRDTRRGRIAGMAKKAAVVGVGTLGVGLVAGMVAGVGLPIGAAAAGGYAMNRLTKAWMGAKISRKNQEHELLVDQRSKALDAEIDHQLTTDEDGIRVDNPIKDARELSASALTVAVEKQMNKEVKGNRIRAGVAIAGLAIAGAGMWAEHLNVFGSEVHGHSGGGAKPTTDSTPKLPVNNPHNHDYDLDKPASPKSSPSAHVELKGARYPWNWAADKFGADNASEKLIDAVHKAKAAGVDVSTHKLPNGGFDISVGNSYDTQKVADALNPYLS